MTNATEARTVPPLYRHTAERLAVALRKIPAVGDTVAGRFTVWAVTTVTDWACTGVYPSVYVLARSRAADDPTPWATFRVVLPYDRDGVQASGVDEDGGGGYHRTAKRAVEVFQYRRYRERLRVLDHDPRAPAGI